MARAERQAQRAYLRKIGLLVVPRFKRQEYRRLGIPPKRWSRPFKLIGNLNK